MSELASQPKQPPALSPAKASFYRLHWKGLATTGAIILTAAALRYGIPAYVQKVDYDKIKPRVEALIQNWQADSLTRGQKAPSFGDCREFLEIGPSHHLTTSDMLALIELRDTVNLRGSAIDSLKSAFEGEKLTLNRVYQTLTLYPMWLAQPDRSAKNFDYNTWLSKLQKRIKSEFRREINSRNGEEMLRFIRIREVVLAAVGMLGKSECGERLRLDAIKNSANFGK